MNNKYIVVSGGAILGDSSQLGPARSKADSAAREALGGEVVLYERVNVFKAKIVVEDDSPKDARAEES